MNDQTLFSIFFSAMVVNNFTLALFLGLCPFMGVSRSLEAAAGMSLATAFVLTIFLTPVAIKVLRAAVASGVRASPSRGRKANAAATEMRRARGRRSSPPDRQRPKRRSIRTILSQRP